MSPARQANPNLDILIAEITADAHDEDEQLIGFENAFDEDANLPCPGTIIGDPTATAQTFGCPTRPLSSHR